MATNEKINRSARFAKVNEIIHEAYANATFLASLQQAYLDTENDPGATTLRALLLEHFELTSAECDLIIQDFETHDPYETTERATLWV